MVGRMIGYEELPYSIYSRTINHLEKELYYVYQNYVIC